MPEEIKNVFHACGRCGCFTFLNISWNWSLNKPWWNEHTTTHAFQISEVNCISMNSWMSLCIYFFKLNDKNLKVGRYHVYTCQCQWPGATKSFCQHRSEALSSVDAAMIFGKLFPLSRFSCICMCKVRFSFK